MTGGSPVIRRDWEVTPTPHGDEDPQFPGRNRNRDACGQALRSRLCASLIASTIRSLRKPAGRDLQVAEWGGALARRARAPSTATPDPASRYESRPEATGAAPCAAHFRRARPLTELGGAYSDS
jgi:hypothetical protein